MYNYIYISRIATNCNIFPSIINTHSYSFITLSDSTILNHGFSILYITMKNVVIGGTNALGSLVKTCEKNCEIY